MAPIVAPVRQYMSQPVVEVSPTARLGEVEARLTEHGISALAVVDGVGAVVGVVSRTDLLRVGEVERTGPSSFENLRLPDLRVSEVMATEPATVEEDVTVQDAARRMVDRGIHRVFVTRGGTLSGVLSTRDIMDALVDKAVRTPISELASYGLIEVEATDPISLAIDRMGKSHKHGLVVVDQGWPVGIFAQADALAARGAPPETAVEHVMNLSILMLPGNLPVARAAAQANALRVRRILVMEESGVEGILSGIDFARAAL